MFKTKVTFLVTKFATPAEIFCFKKVFDNLHNINYNIINDEALIQEKKEIIIWEDLIYNKSNVININNVKNSKNETYILIGNSTLYDQYKNDLNKTLKNQVLEYENSHTILFERV